MTPLSVCLNYVEYFDLYNLKTADRGVKFSSTKRYKIVSIKTFCRVVLVHTFEQRFKDYTFGRVRNVLHRGYKFHAVLFQCVLMDSHFVLVPRKTVKFINSDTILWTLKLVNVKINI